MKIGTKVILKDGRVGKIIKHIKDNVYRIQLVDGFRTVLEDSEFDCCG